MLINQRVKKYGQLLSVADVIVFNLPTTKDLENLNYGHN